MSFKFQGIRRQIHRLVIILGGAALGTVLFSNCGKPFEVVEVGSMKASSLGTPAACSPKNLSGPTSQLNRPFLNSKVVLQSKAEKNIHSKLTPDDLVPAEVSLLVIVGQPCLSEDSPEDLQGILGSAIEVDIRKRNPKFKSQAFPIRLKEPLRVEVIERVSQINSCVIGITNNNQVRIEQTADDPALQASTAAFNQAIQLEKIKLLNSKNQSGAPIRVAVVDTGVDITHPDLQKMIDGQVLHNVTSEPSYDIAGHGTHVAGLISQVVAFDPTIVKIVPIKALTTIALGPESDIYNGVQKAIELKVDLISMSLGSTSEESRAIHQAYIDSILAENIPMVVSAGNSNKELGSPTMPGFQVNPASLSAVEGVISVGSLDLESGTRSVFSNFGNIVDMSTFGCYKSNLNDPKQDVGLVSTYLGGKYKGMCGTSMATPVMSGMVALLMKSHRVHKSPLGAPAVEQALKANVTNQGAPQLPRSLDINKFLDGLLSLASQSQPQPQPQPQPLPQPLPSPAGNPPVTPCE